MPTAATIGTRSRLFGKGETGAAGVGREHKGVGCWPCGLCRSTRVVTELGWSLRKCGSSAVGEGRCDRAEEGHDRESRREDDRADSVMTLGHLAYSFLGQSPELLPVGYARAMRKSTIAKHRTGGRDSIFARALGHEIRQRREALGLTQTLAAGPLTRAFVSSIERGRFAPSLSSLLIIARQLNTSAATILRAVELQLEAHDSGDQDQTDIPR